MASLLLVEPGAAVVIVGGALSEHDIHKLRLNKHMNPMVAMMSCGEDEWLAI